MANRTIRIFKKYFTEFYLEQTETVKRKINYCLNMVKTVDRVPSSILCKMEGVDGLYEVRVEVGSNIFRIFCCFDEGVLVILFNGFQKKTQKTPKNEIEKAKRLMKEYFNEKRNE
ncbi:MAG: type II toxin-antitoxin system RelE/ParE family toxin [Muribaculaceae bacterium]|nr:type II toxin-antitoxin system RelE/ParE family toxin [Muribaculaceae bacterium]